MTDLDKIVDVIEEHFVAFPRPSVSAGLMLDVEKMSIPEGRIIEDRLKLMGYDIYHLPVLDYSDGNAVKIKSAHTHEILVVLRKGAYT